METATDIISLLVGLIVGAFCGALSAIMLSRQRREGEFLEGLPRCPVPPPSPGAEPVMFYYEDAVDAWVPVPDELAQYLHQVLDEDDLGHHERAIIRLKKVYLTREEFDALKDAN